ncbi:MAG: IS200/IS605 family transposase [Bacteroidetes bacterium]|nr:IS200/IS605 family transposase [Bacteroidota bacterium]
MANTYTQIHIHLVFAVADRASLIHSGVKDGLYKYMTGVVQRRGHKLLAINGMPDHVHLLIGLRPEMALSSLVRDVKAFSAKHVNDEHWMRNRFGWQVGYGAFSYSKTQIPSVIRYIERREQHHRVLTFREEYLELLKRFEVEYDPNYLFRWIDDDVADSGPARS